MSVSREGAVVLALAAAESDQSPLNAEALQGIAGLPLVETAESLHHILPPQFFQAATLHGVP